MNFKGLTVGLALVSAFAFGMTSYAGDTAKPMLVKVHADRCGTCVRLESTWRRIEAELGDHAELLVLDVTDRETLEAARAAAQRFGISSFFDRYKSQTGIVGVLDPTGDTVAVLRGEQDFSRYEQALAEAARGS